MSDRNSRPSQDLLTPADCDLRRTPAMPIDIARLFGSDFYALSTGAEFKAAIALWCKSFHHLPAASLPADEALLAHLSGAGEQWAAVRGMALAAWEQQAAGRRRTAAATAAARAARSQGGAGATAASNIPAAGSATGIGRASYHDGLPDTGIGTARHAVTDSVTVVARIPPAKFSREGSTFILEPPEAAMAPADRGGSFDAFWGHYPRKVGKRAAEKAYIAALERGAPEATILMAVRVQRWASDRKYLPYAATWLHQDRWLDDPDAAAPPEDPKFRNGFAQAIHAEFGPCGLKHEFILIDETAI